MTCNSTVEIPHTDLARGEQAAQSCDNAKLNRYLAFVESGELLERYSAAKRLAVRFAVVFKFKPDMEAIEFLRKAKKVIESAGFSLETSVFAESYDNGLA